MKNILLLGYFIAFLLPANFSSQSTTSTVVSIQLGDFHQLSLPRLDEQTLFLNFDSSEKFNENNEETPVVMSSTGVFNLFARAANQGFVTLNDRFLGASGLLSLEVDDDGVLGRGLAQLDGRLGVGFKDSNLKSVSNAYANALKNNKVIVASQSIVNYGKPMMGKALKFKYLVSSKKAFEFFKETDPESADKAIIYTITSY
jgi:hypothetical protein